MIRRSLTFASLLLLLLSAAIAAWWAWSWRVSDTFTRVEGRYPLVPNGVTDPSEPDFHLMNARILVVRLQANCGRLSLSVERSVPNLMLGPDNLPDWQPQFPDGVHYRWEQEPADSYWDDPVGIGKIPGLHAFHLAGFHFATYSIPSISINFMSFTGWYLQCPIGALLIVTMALPLFQLARALRRARVRRRAVSGGCCLKCGYDLRASEGRCPECGTPMPKEMDPVR